MLVLEARQSGKPCLCFAVCLCAEFVQWDVCVYNLLSSPSLAYVFLRCPVFFLFQPSALHRVDRATRCEQ